MSQTPHARRDIDESETYKSEYEGKTYYFCCKSCKKRFDGKPEKFAPICWHHT